MLPAVGDLLFCKGRVALYAGLRAMGIRRGDEIILPGFTCLVVPNAIVYAGAKPVYVDIERKTYNINPALIEAKITRKTRAIIAQHTFGIPAEMDQISQIARKYNLYLIEDSAHAVGSTYKGREVGSFGDVAFFSSQWSKPVTTGQGGWAVVNHPEVAVRMKAIHSGFRDSSWKEVGLLRLQYFAFAKLLRPSLFWYAQDTYRALSKLGIGSGATQELEGRMPEGYATRMSSWQRNLLTRNLGKIESLTRHRQQVSHLYDDLLKERGIRPLEHPRHCNPVLLRYPLLVRDKPTTLNEARARRIEIGDWFVSPVHPRRDRWDVVGYQKGMCPTAEEVARHVVNLPTHAGIGQRDIQRIVALIAKQAGD